MDFRPHLAITWVYILVVNFIYLSIFLYFVNIFLIFALALFSWVPICAYASVFVMRTVISAFAAI